MMDIGFINDNFRFRYRTGAFIINNDKMLFCKSKNDEYYYFLGGGVQHSETSSHCVEREIFEETALHAHVERLAVVVENIFEDKDKNGQDRKCHTIEFYYKVNVDNFEGMNSETDTNAKLEWIPVDKLKDMDIRPKKVVDKAMEILRSKNIIHIVNDESKSSQNL